MQRERKLDSETLWVTGHGYYNKAEDEFSQQLRLTKLHLGDDDDCPWDVEQSKTICAAANVRGGHICFGDSGSPVFTKVNGQIKQVGLVSFGDPDICYQTSNVLTRISYYNDWIQKTMTLNAMK